MSMATPSVPTVVSSDVKYFVDVFFAEDLFTRNLCAGMLRRRIRAQSHGELRGKVKLLCPVVMPNCTCWPSACVNVTGCAQLMRETHSDPAVRSSECVLPRSQVFKDNQSVIKWVKNPCTHS